MSESQAHIFFRQPVLPGWTIVISTPRPCRFGTGRKVVCNYSMRTKRCMSRGQLWLFPWTPEFLEEITNDQTQTYCENDRATGQAEPFPCSSHSALVRMWVTGKTQCQSTLPESDPVIHRKWLKTSRAKGSLGNVRIKPKVSTRKGTTTGKKVIQT